MKKILLIVLLMAAVGGTYAFWPGGRKEGDAHGKKVIVIGMDGMDPRLCERLMNEGKLPNFAKLRNAGGYRPLGTSIPPQSPVAWSNFITGADPGMHGIFDFIHRDPAKQCEAYYYSSAETRGGDGAWEVGDYQIPLTFWPFNHRAPQTVLKREGTPFWDYLDKAGIPIRIYDIPANYPPSESHHGHMCCLAGMGVPDLMGTYGTYQRFSEDTIVFNEKPGGINKPLSFEGNTATAELWGPQDSVHKVPGPGGRPEDERTLIPFKIHRGAEDEARIDIADQTIVLKKGEWSDWVKVAFEMKRPSFLPNEHAPGICRFYLQEVRPVFRLYVSPINIDPSDPAGQKVTEPEDFVEDISADLGLFSTLGFQEEHNALVNKAFTDEEYRVQADQVLTERFQLLDYALNHYKDGFLFFYFSSTDQQAHMYWWDSDDPHPVRGAEDAQKYNAVVADVYGRMDEAIGKITARLGSDATIIVMSDHGFCNFRREFNLNSWLRDEGYIQPADCQTLVDIRDPGKRPVDWKVTKAYGLGINSLYVNLAGRERDGIVPSAERSALLDQISEKLLAVRDPENGAPVIAHVYRTDQVYHGPQAANAPDLIVGYHRGYRASWATIEGNVYKKVFQDNKKAWSADHCIAAEEVPGVIFSNRPLLRDDPSLVDLAPTILYEFGLPPAAHMRGGSVFAPRPAGSPELTTKE